MRILPILFALLAAVSPVSAGLLYAVHFDTTTLDPVAMYTADFQLIGSNGNTVNLTNFSYGSGSGPTGPYELDTIGNFFNEVMVPFLPGASLDFEVASTNLPPPSGGFPDELSLFLLDSGGNPLPTADPADSFFYLDVTGAQPNIQTFGDPGGVPAPSLTAIPEPAPIWLVAAGLGLVMLSRSARRGRPA